MALLLGTGLLASAANAGFGLRVPQTAMRTCCTAPLLCGLLLMHQVNQALLLLLFMAPQARSGKGAAAAAARCSGWGLAHECRQPYSTAKCMCKQRIAAEA